MKKGLFFSLLLISLYSNSQVTQRNILGNKYSLVTLRASLLAKNDYYPYPKMPKAWRVSVPDSILVQLVKAGESVLDYKFEPISASLSLNFVRTGDRQEHAKVSYAKRVALTKLILAESIEDKGRFTETIINGVWSICEESFWGVPAHIGGVGMPDIDNPVVELFSAETAAVLALTDYLVGDKMDQINKQFRKRIYTETNKRLFVPMQTKSDGYSWMSKIKPVNNWNPWIESNYMMALLLLEKDAIRRSEMLYQSMIGLDLYLNGLGDEGGCDEGPSYWFAAGASVYDCLEILHTATNAKVDVYDEILIKKMASYIYKTHISGQYFVNFADADPTLTPDGLMIYRFGKAINDSSMIAMGQWAVREFSNDAKTQSQPKDGYHRPRYFQNLLTLQTLSKETVAYQPTKDVWISDVQLLAARTSNGYYLAAHGGHNAESHNHNDVGDFIVYSDGEPVIIDAGRGNYTARTFSPQRYDLWFTQSQYHNLPIVNGLAQLAGRDYAASNVTPLLSEKETSLSMNIAAAYAKEAGILEWNRTVKLNRLKQQIEIADSYELASKPTFLQQVFMTVCKTDISVPGKIQLTTSKQQKHTIIYDATLWDVTIDLPSTEGAEYSSFKTKWDNNLVQRIVLSRKNLSQKGKCLFIVRKS